jgi:hypothetical protein
VARFREDSGNAGMIARELPPDEVLASWQHIEQRALDLRAAGMPGTLQELHGSGLAWICCRSGTAAPWRVTWPPPPGTGPADYLASLRIRLAPIARGRCGHARAEPGYRPSRKLQHLVRARTARCTAPGCGQQAARCDLDHIIARDHGGLTCECDLAPPCMT